MCRPSSIRSSGKRRAELKLPESAVHKQSNQPVHEFPIADIVNYDTSGLNNANLLS